jgi:Zn-dependent protease with chaperone function
MSRKPLAILVLFLALGTHRVAIAAQDVPAAPQPATEQAFEAAIPKAAQASDHFDVAAATDAYLAEVSPEKKARSDAYFEGGYWLILCDFLAGAIVYLILLFTGLSAAMRDFAERMIRFRPLQTFIYWTEFFLFIAIVTFPLTYYEGYVREHHYGLATQTFGPWMGDQLKALVLNLILGGILMMALYGIVRRLPRTWWIGGAAVTVVFMLFILLLAPVYIAPLFNKYTKLQDPRIKDPILSMARANGIPATEIYVVDASRQSTRVSANVSGFLGTERITLNDNLLKRCSLEEIEAVMGHEMGHYVLNHIPKDVFFYAVLLYVAFAYLRFGGEWALKRWGGRWKTRGIDDTAALPLVFLLVSIFFFVITPITNTQTRTEEYEADIFGLNASRQPDGEAQVDLKLGDYRKLDPSPVEEFIFFDHPSGRTRITAAMRWKAEHLSGFMPKQTPTPESPRPEAQER